MSLLGEGVIASWSEVDPAVIDDVRAWHSHEHIPERLTLPGFLRARRYAGLDGPTAWFILYEVETFAALTTPEYLARLNAPTDWTRRSIVHLRNSMRGLGKVVSSSGHYEGGFIATIRSPTIDRNTFDRFACRCLEIPAIIGVHLCATDRSASTIPTKERALRSVDTPGHFLIMESIDLAALHTISRVAATALETPSRLDFFRLEMLATV